MNKRIENQINAVGLKMEFDELKPQVEKVLKRIEIEIIMIDLQYEDKLRDFEMRNKLHEKQAELLKQLNHIDDIEQKAIAYNNLKLVLKCEALKIEVRNLMEHVRNKYMF